MPQSALYIIALAFSLGIFIRTFFVLDEGVIYVLFLGGGVCGVVWFRKRKGRETSSRALFASLLFSLALISFALGIVRYDRVAQNSLDVLAERYIEQEVVLEGIIIREVDERENTTQLTVRADMLNGAPADVRLLVLTERFPRFSYGDRIRAEGVLEHPDSFETDLGRTFDYAGYLSARGISYVAPFARVEKISEGNGNPIMSALLSFKYDFMHNVERLVPEPAAGLAHGLVLGVKRALGEDLERSFRVAGIIHIVVLSGYNITIVVEATMRLLSYFFRSRTRVAFGALAIVAFALIAGFSSTVVRASFMAVLVLIARATGRTYEVLRALMLAGLVMLIINPKLLVFDPGFQLSFLATLGLILLAPLIEEHLSLVPTKFQIREFITATVATQIFVLPLLLYSIGEFSLVALIVNVLVLPVVPFAMLFVFLSGMIGFMSTMFALPFAYSAYLLLEYIIAIAEWFAALPFAALIVPAFPFWITIIAYALMAYAMYRISTTQQIEAKQNNF